MNRRHPHHLFPTFILQADGSRISSVCANGELVSSPFNECHTLVDCFLRGLRVSKQADNRCFGWRPAPDQPFSWMTYQDAYQRAKNFGSGFLVRMGFVGAGIPSKTSICLSTNTLLSLSSHVDCCNAFLMRRRIS